MENMINLGTVRHAPTTKRVTGFVALLLAFAAIGGAIAQSGGEFTLSWSTIDGGGGRSSGGAYTLNGSIGQPDAGRMTGGVYTLNGGFFALPAPIISPPGSAPLLNYFTFGQAPLTWNRVTGAAGGYYVQVAREAAFTNIVFVGDTTELTITTVPLTSGRYYWRVCARNASNVCGAWSVVDSFTVNVP